MLKKLYPEMVTSTVHKRHYYIVECGTMMRALEEIRNNNKKTEAK